MERVLIYGAGQGDLHMYEEIENEKQQLEVIRFIGKRSGAKSRLLPRFLRG